MSLYIIIAKTASALEEEVAMKRGPQKRGTCQNRIHSGIPLCLTFIINIELISYGHPGKSDGQSNQEVVGFLASTLIKKN